MLSLFLFQLYFAIPTASIRSAQLHHYDRRVSLTLEVIVIVAIVINRELVSVESNSFKLKIESYNRDNEIFSSK